MEENPLLDACHNCTARGSKLSVVTKGKTTYFRLRSNRLEMLQAARADFLRALTCDLFEHAEKDLLWSRPGVAKMEAMLKEQSMPGYLHWDKATRSVRIFGRPIERERSKEMLEGLVRELQQLEKNTVMLDRSKTREWEAQVGNVVRGLGIEHCNLNKNSGLMEYWVADANKVTLLKEVLTSRGWESQPRRVLSEGTCCLCMCDFDKDTYQFQACRHSFCTACLKGAFSDPDGAHFPITCPYSSDTERCNATVVWNDIAGLLSGEVLARVKRIAVAKYLRDNPQDAISCPRPSCNHVLQAARPVTSLEEEKSVGGQKVFCEVCATGYCVACSEEAKGPVPLHHGYTCEEARKAGVPDVKKHREAISQILTLKCPRCSRAFFDYSGCAAVKCGSCNCGFCAKCFKDCGADAHDHTSNCRGPGIPNIPQVETGYWLSAEEFNRLNLQVAELRILEYLNTKACKCASRVSPKALPGRAGAKSGGGECLSG